MVGDAHRTGALVHQVAPHALQEPLRPDDVPRRPGPGDLHRPSGHLVQAERVGAVGLAHLVGRHHVAQRLAHLPVLPADGLAVPRETAVCALDDLLGRDVRAAGVGVGVGLDVALVEQPAERLLRADVAEVEQHLVPEPRVQQVQHGVLDAADVQVDAAGVVRARRVLAHPVPLDLGVDEPLVVLRVQVAQVVPARAGPLRHRVGLADVAVVDVHPLRGARQRRLRLGVGGVGVVGLGGVVVDLGQLDGQLVVGQRDRRRRRPRRRERLAPVALAGEQPVAQLVLDHGVARAAGGQPLDDRALGLGDAHAVQADSALAELMAGPSPVNASPSQPSAAARCGRSAGRTPWRSPSRAGPARARP